MSLEASIVIAALAVIVAGQQFMLHACKLWIREAHELLLEHEALLRPNERTPPIKARRP